MKEVEISKATVFAAINDTGIDISSWQVQYQSAVKDCRNWLHANGDVKKAQEAAKLLIAAVS